MCLAWGGWVGSTIRFEWYLAIHAIARAGIVVLWFTAREGELFAVIGGITHVA